jgi:hypothetical protein
MTFALQKGSLIDFTRYLRKRSGIKASGELKANLVHELDLITITPCRTLGHLLVDADVKASPLPVSDTFKSHFALHGSLLPNTGTNRGTTMFDSSNRGSMKPDTQHPYFPRR